VLSIITIEQNEKWDSIVKGFENYDVNYLSGYAKAFAVHGEGEPLLFYYDDGDTKGINVVMKRDIALEKPFNDKLPINTLFDLSTPYGYGGFLINGENHHVVNQAYDNYCREMGYVSEFVRFHLINNYQSNYNGSIETHTHNIIRTLDMPFDDMLMDFEHKVRKSLKKAAKAELKIVINTTGARLDEFLNIYYGTMNRSNAKETFYFSEEFFESLNKMENNYIYFHVLYKKEIISTELVLYGNENCYSFLGGTKKEFFHLCSNNFLKYEIIKWAKNKGLKRFILGGGYGADDGIFKYKKSFAPSGITEFYIGKKIFNQEKYNELVQIRSADKNFNANTLFFPSYRG
jgi:Acetyltransferase (GNAT) domain